MTTTRERGNPLLRWKPSHLQRHLDASRAAVGIEHAVEASRRHLDQRRRQLLCRLVGQAGEDHLVERFGGVTDRLDDLRMPVAVGDDPPGRDRIEGALAVRRPDIRTLGARDHGWHRLGGMLDEGMPCHLSAKPLADRRRMRRSYSRPNLEAYSDTVWNETSIPRSASNFDMAQAERKPEIQPHRIRNDLGRWRL